jgi:murein DD-endopeptidase MepM/ murein hydrolase activator NlpD
LFVGCVAVGCWVLVMTFVLGSTRPVVLPKQLASRHVSGPIVTISANTWTEADARPQRPVEAGSDDQSASLMWPTRVARLSSTFGYRINPISHEGQVHQGIDVPAPCGTEVVAAEEGIVTVAEWTHTAGNIVVIAHDGGWVTRYLHLSRSRVHAGQRVGAGELIAFSGDTGSMSTGPHLHFEVWSGKTAVDPMSFRYRALGGTAHPLAVVCEKTSRPQLAAAPTLSRSEPEADPAAASVEQMYARLVAPRR